MSPKDLTVWEIIGTDGDWNKKSTGEMSKGLDKQPWDFQKICETDLDGVQKHMNSDGF